DEPVAAHPHLIFGLGQIGHDVAALVVGDHHLGVTGGEILGLRDHPDAGLRSVCASDHAPDVVVVDGYGGWLLRGDLDHRAWQSQRNGNRRRTEIQLAFRHHLVPPLAFPCLPNVSGPSAGPSRKRLSAEMRPLSITGAQRRHAWGRKAGLAQPHLTNVPARSSSIWMRTISSNELSALKPSSRARCASMRCGQPATMRATNGSSAW